MCEQLKGKSRCNLGKHNLPENDLFQKRSLHARRTRCARQRVINQKVQRAVTLGMACVFDLRNQLAHKRRIINRLRVQPLLFARFNLGQVVSVQAHLKPRG